MNLQELERVLPHLLDQTLTPDGEIFFELKEGDRTWYSRLSVNPVYLKPKKKDIVARHEELKLENKMPENDTENKKEIRNRLKKIKDIRWCMNELSITDEPNYELFIKKIIKEVNFALLEQLEAKNLMHASIVAQAAQEEANIKKEIKELKNLLSDVEDKNAKRILRVLISRMGI